MQTETVSTVSVMTKQEIINVAEKHSKEFFAQTKDALKLFKKTQFSTLLEGMMSESIFIQIRDNIIKNPFLRQNFSVTYTIEHHKINNEYVIVKAVDEYEIVNLSEHTCDFMAYASITKENDDVFPKSSKFEVLTILQKGNIIEYDSKNINGFSQFENNRIIFKKKLELDPKEVIRITTSRTKVLLIRDSNHWNVPQICNGMKLIVNHAEDIMVSVSISHPAKDKLKKLLDKNNEKRWFLDAGILPYQGMTIHWRPVDKSV